MRLPIRPERLRTNIESETARLLAHAALMVAEAMEYNGITQTQLAKRVGTHQQAIGRMLSADFGMTLRTLARLAFAMGYRVRLTFERL